MDFRMKFVLTIVTAFAVLGANATEELQKEPVFRHRYSRSPAVEVVMTLPPAFHNVDEFATFLGLRPQRRRRDVASSDPHPPEPGRNLEVTGSDSEMSEPQAEKLILPADTYQPADTFQTLPEADRLMAPPPDDFVVHSAQLMVEPPYPPNFGEFSQYKGSDLDLLEQTPPSDPNAEDDDFRKRRNTSANDHEDKRGYPEPGASQEGSTPSPFWKHKKAPPFVTAREGRQGYDQPQHRANDNNRESHSMKDGGKGMASNEIPRMGGDSYYSASNSNAANSRAYSPRPADTPPPKSVYDTIDYTARRTGMGRNADSRGRLTADAYGPRPYDRYYYPMGPEVAGRGVEYYHRSVDPGTGRIVYYASLPEPEAYRASRTYAYDAYGRSFPPMQYPAYPAYPYQPYNPYNPYTPYQPYTSSPQDLARNSRYQQPLAPLPSARYDRYDRNKTYVIYDADEKRSPGTYAPKAMDDRNRYAPPLPYPSFPTPPMYQPYQPYPVYTYSGYNTYRGGYMDQRGLVKQVELPLTTRSALATRPTLKPVSS